MPLVDEERRRYFRIEDTIGIIYEIVSDAEAKQRELEMTQPDYSSRSELNLVERRLQLLIDKLSADWSTRIVTSQDTDQRLVSLASVKSHYWVLDSNRRAIDFYEAMGFINDGKTKTEQRDNAVELREVRYRRQLGAKDACW